jgi:hypothetical protein
MVPNLTTHDIYNSIVNDFNGAWNSIATNQDENIGRGNFMFASQAMHLLEFAGRLYDKDTNAHQKFSKDLYDIEPKYFIELPGRARKPRGFLPPYIGNTKDKTLLWALFDLIRNGLAHQSQQIIAELADGKHFYISLTGAEYGRILGADILLVSLIMEIIWDCGFTLISCSLILKKLLITSLLY